MAEQLERSKNNEVSSASAFLKWDKAADNRTKLNVKVPLPNYHFPSAELAPQISPFSPMRLDNFYRTPPSRSLFEPYSCYGPTTEDLGNYFQFRRRVLEHRLLTSGQRSASSFDQDARPKVDGCKSTDGSPSSKSSSKSDDVKNESYWERRRKNNEAAKRSRDSRRAKEDEISIRAAFLEQENLRLKIELTRTGNEITKLTCLLHNLDRELGLERSSY